MMKAISFILFFLLLSCNDNKINKNEIKHTHKITDTQKVEIDEVSNLQQKDNISGISKYLKVDTILFFTDNENSFQLGKSERGDNGWNYAQVINDSIIFAYDDLHFNMKLLNVYSGKVDTVVNDYVEYDFQSFKAIRGELFRHANTILYRFDSNLDLKDSIVVGENLSDEYAQCDFVENGHATPICLDVLYPKGFKKTEINEQELTNIPYLERVSDSTIQYGINLYGVRPLPKNTTFIFFYKNKIYSGYSLVGRYMLLIHYYQESLKGY